MWKLGTMNEPFCFFFLTFQVILCILCICKKKKFNNAKLKKKNKQISQVQVL